MHNSKQSSNELNNFKKRLKTYLANISDNQYIYNDEVKEALTYISEELVLGKRCVLLQGNVGTGKTEMFKAAIEVLAPSSSVNAVKYYDALEIEEDFRINGFKAFNKYYHGSIVIDELGLESKLVKVKYDDEAINVIEYLLLKRYKLFIDSSGKFRTHMITNLSDSQLLERYGERVYSRITHMRGKKITIVGNEKENFRNKGFVFKYYKFDWQKYKEGLTNTFNGDIDALAKQSINDSITRYIENKRFSDAGNAKWKWLIEKKDKVAMAINEREKPDNVQFSLDDTIAGKTNKMEQCFGMWLKEVTKSGNINFKL
jgi:DNA replication protein DnaC